jgi:hypothetical protein
VSEICKQRKEETSQEKKGKEGQAKQTGREGWKREREREREREGERERERERERG